MIHVWCDFSGPKLEEAVLTTKKNLRQNTFNLWFLSSAMSKYLMLFLYDWFKCTTSMSKLTKLLQSCRYKKISQSTYLYFESKNYNIQPIHYTLDILTLIHIFKFMLRPDFLITFDKLFNRSLCSATVVLAIIILSWNISMPFRPDLEISINF